MLMNRRFHHLAWLFIILSAVSWKVAYALNTAYVVGPGGIITPAAAFPPLQLGAGDSLRVTSTGLLDGFGIPAVQVQAGAGIMITNEGGGGHSKPGYSYPKCRRQ